MLEAYQTGNRRYADDRAAALVPPLRQLSEVGKTALSGGGGGPSGSSAHRTATAVVDEGLVLRVCGERALGDLLAHRAAGERPTVPPQEPGRLFVYGKATVLPVLAATCRPPRRPLLGPALLPAPHPPLPVWPGPCPDAAAASRLDAAGFIIKLKELLQQATKFTSPSNEEARGVNGAGAAASAAAEWLHDPDPPFWRVLDATGGDGGRQGPRHARAGAAAAALALEARPGAAALPPLRRFGEHAPQPWEAQAAPAEPRYAEALVVWRPRERERVLVVEADATSQGGLYSRPGSAPRRRRRGAMIESPFAVEEQGGSCARDLSVGAALAAMGGAWHCVSATAIKAQGLKTMQPQTLPPPPPPPPEPARAGGEERRVDDPAAPRPAGFEVAPGSIVHLRRVLLVDSQRAPPAEVWAAPRSPGGQEAACDVLVGSNEAVLCAIAHWLNGCGAGIASPLPNPEGSLPRNPPPRRGAGAVEEDERGGPSGYLAGDEVEEVEGEEDVDIFESIGAWVRWGLTLGMSKQSGRRVQESAPKATLVPELVTGACKVVVVDTDSEDFLALMRDTLRPLGYHVAIPGDQAEAVGILVSSQPHPLPAHALLEKIWLVFVARQLRLHLHLASFRCTILAAMLPQPRRAALLY